MSYRWLAKDDRHEQEEEGASGEEPVDDTGGAPDLAALYGLIQKSLQTQDRESFKQEQRWRSVQVQLNGFQDELEQCGDGGGEPPPAIPPAPAAPPAGPQMPATPPAAPAPAMGTRAAIPRLEEGDDVEQYLTTFERLATAYRWTQAVWAIFLVPYLTGRARSGYVAMDPYDVMDYFKVKAAFLAKYEISAKVYRQRFRDPNLQPGERVWRVSTC
ncbi:uncharacterized protein LOC114553223 [Perca flavescens]|uniref:uncharacterized protein LOC114553223 n=1 Tax=Perca flavescens TaxID=8167 RepID=UPI00106EA88B|nr:uncharacterized protein LOC114553223 [Perca flavescens]XP_028430237.1 uncharacterized protein LOC114553223 [Perca flavescens]XP_028430238.1 uncharacterized protein LOC114553223 [Perca flavescens]